MDQDPGVSPYWRRLPGTIRTRCAEFSGGFTTSAATITLADPPRFQLGYIVVHLRRCAAPQRRGMGPLSVHSSLFRPVDQGCTADDNPISFAISFII